MEWKAHDQRTKRGGSRAARRQAKAKQIEIKKLMPAGYKGIVGLDTHYTPRARSHPLPPHITTFLQYALCKCPGHSGRRTISIFK